VFTGLVEDIGRISEVAPLPRGSGERLRIVAKLLSEPLPLGASLAVDGVCLTVVESSPGQAAVEVGPETRARTTLQTLALGRRVHLERALRVSDRLGGHIVTGHVDGIGHVESSVRRGDSWDLHVETPAPLLRYIVEKGAICIDGVSLTVNQVTQRSFAVSLVPHTQAHTHLAEKGPDAAVNLEVDIIAKHVEKLIAAYLPGRATGLSLEKLKEFGFASGD
jgi:riboflavin synthase